MLALYYWICSVSCTGHVGWHEWFPLQICPKPGSNFMFKTESQAGMTTELSLVDHRIKEATALFATGSHLLSSDVQWGLNIGCTCSTWVPLPPAQSTALKISPNHKPGSGTRLRINQEAVRWMIQCCLLPQAVNMNHLLQLGTILLTTSF